MQLGFPSQAHKDHLGNWTTITDDEGSVEQELSFDAWGNMRNPETWSGGSSLKPMFDRGFTGHEHLSAFGLINMNGRMYDPIMSSFLSVDALVNDPTCAQGFNRYAYCMYNPLKYVDPSGWQPLGGMGPNPFHDDWSVSHVIPAHEPRDFCNAYYLCNLAFYGSFDGPWCDGGGGGGGEGIGSCGFTETYGYYVTHYAKSVYNYTSSYAQMQLIQNWQNNPSISTNRDLREAGITYLSVGVVNYGNGTSSSYYQWTATGNTHYAEALNEYTGNTEKEYYCMSNQPLWMYENSIMGWPRVENTASSTIPPAPHYLSVPNAVSVIGGQATLVQSAAYLTEKTCQGAEVFGTIGRTAGKISGIISIGTAAVSTFNRCEYYKNGGDNVGVAVIGVTDVAFTVAGFFWPWGTVASVVYFSTEMITDDFWEWGKVR